MYVGKSHKMFVSSASCAGVDADLRPSFDTPQEGSLQLHLDKLWKSKMALYEMNVELGSKYIASTKPYYIMTFSPVGENLDLKGVINAKVACERAITVIDDLRRDGDLPNSLKELPQPGIKYIDTIDPSDLPF